VPNTYWDNTLKIAYNWLADEQIMPKRLLRLKILGCRKKLNWIDTYNAINDLVNQGYAVNIPNYTNWLTLPCYLDDISQVPSTQDNHIVNIKLWILKNWNALSHSLSDYSEVIFKKAFENAGYTVQRRKNLPVTNPLLQLDPLFRGVNHVQIDLLCKKNNYTLGVEVKSSISDVFMNPLTIAKNSVSNRRIVRWAKFCKSQSYIPIFVAPFIDRSFYPFMDNYNGLHCQTYLQYFNPLDEEHVIAYNFIKGFPDKGIEGFLNYNNIRLVDRVPDWIERWIDRIPKMWNTRYSSRSGIII
jgi:hypothetical protein